MFLRRLSNAVALLLNSFGTLVTPRLILFSTHDFRALLSIHAAFYTICQDCHSGVPDAGHSLSSIRTSSALAKLKWNDATLVTCNDAANVLLRFMGVIPATTIIQLRATQYVLMRVQQKNQFKEN